jgi:predicted nucleotidyltransferase
MTRFEALREDRRRRRQIAVQAAWDAIHAGLKDRGIEHRLFGSLAKGDVRERSDLDIMIMDDLSADQRARVRRLAEAEASRAGIDLDLLFAADMTHRDVEALLEH